MSISDTISSFHQANTWQSHVLLFATITSLALLRGHQRCPPLGARPGPPHAPTAAGAAAQRRELRQRRRPLRRRLRGRRRRRQRLGLGVDGAERGARGAAGDAGSLVKENIGEETQGRAGDVVDMAKDRNV